MGSSYLAGMFAAGFVAVADAVLSLEEVCLVVHVQVLFPEDFLLGVIIQSITLIAAVYNDYETGSPVPP